MYIARKKKANSSPASVSVTALACQPSSGGAYGIGVGDDGGLYCGQFAGRRVAGGGGGGAVDTPCARRRARTVEASGLGGAVAVRGGGCGARLPGMAKAGRRPVVD